MVPFKLLNFEVGARRHCTLSLQMGERPFPCEEEGCGYAASSRSKLKRHIRTHTGERPYSCEVEGCGYTATVRSALKRHVATRHGRA